MKDSRIKALIIFSIFCGLFSCDDPVPFNPFLGTWKFVHETFTSCDNSTDEGAFDYPCHATDCRKIIFQEKGKLVQEVLTSGAKTTVNGTYSFEGTELKLCFTGCNDPYTFLVAGNTLKLAREDDAGCTVTTTLEKVL